jgi:ribose-phosphate pyrophosphokinase
MKPLLFHFPEESKLASSLGDLLGADTHPVDLHQFPDGETLVRLDASCAKREVALLCGGRAATTTALPLYFSAVTARELGATRVGLIAPYLAYMRQDQRFHEGEVVSALAYARFICSSFDWLVTVDAHLHRLRTLDAAYSVPATNVAAMPAIAAWIREQVPDPVIIGPDSESRQWTAQLGESIGAPVCVLDKTRLGDLNVRVSVPDPQLLDGRTPVIVDDVASSGRTLARAVESLLMVGSRAPVCIVVHAVFAGDAEAAVRSAGAGRIVSTNTVSHSTNAIDVAPLIATAARVHLFGDELSR